jgi:hypothetical protein
VAHCAQRYRGSNGHRERCQLLDRSSRHTTQFDRLNHNEIQRLARGFIVHWTLVTRRIATTVHTTYSVDMKTMRRSSLKTIELAAHTNLIATLNEPQRSRAVRAVASWSQLARTKCRHRSCYHNHTITTVINTTVLQSTVVMYSRHTDLSRVGRHVGIANDANCHAVASIAGWLRGAIIGLRMQHHCSTNDRATARKTQKIQSLGLLDDAAGGSPASLHNHTITMSQLTNLNNTHTERERERRHTISPS